MSDHRTVRLLLVAAATRDYLEEHTSHQEAVVGHSGPSERAAEVQDSDLWAEVRRLASPC